MTDAQREAHERMSARLPTRTVLDAEGYDTEAYVESAEVRRWASANRPLSREEQLVLVRMRRRGAR